MASDQKEEWLLPWWWSSYNRFNAFPVTFVDWGMSQEAKKWCEEKGTLVSASLDSFLFNHSPLAPHIEKAIETLGIFFRPNLRHFWFGKPMAMQDSLYDETLWLDLDCEILAPLDPLFEYADCPAGVAIARDTEISQAKNKELQILGREETLYNAGVVAFKKQSPLIAEWAEVCLNRHQEFFDDQNVFAYLVHAKKYEIQELPEVYNWRVSQGLHFSARIVHWVGSWGKAFIRQHGGLGPFLKVINSGFDAR